MIDKYIAQAPTQEEAVAKGLEALGLTRDEATITVNEPGKKGFFGFGQRDAVVVVERKEKRDLVGELLNPAVPEDSMLAAQAAGEVTDSPSEKSAPTQSDAKKSQPKAKKEQPKASLKKDTQPQAAPHAEEKAEKFADVKSEEVAEKPSRTEKEGEKDSANKDADERSEDAAATQAEEELSGEEQDQRAVEAVADYLTRIIRAMNLKDIEVFISRVDNRVTYDLETEDTGMVIGRHGRVLNGLQTLAQNHMHQLACNKLFVKVDAEKYRDRRKHTVERLAERTAQRVQKSGRKVSLNPMPAHERKQIHRYLNRYDGISTHSEGREPHRHLVITPEK